VRFLVFALAIAAAGCSSAGGSATPTTHGTSGHPAPISARVVLPARTMTAGSSMPGRVVVENDTGRAIHTSGCLSLFQVALVSSSYHPSVSWFTCLQRFVIPTGRSSYPVTVAATYNQCGPSKPSVSRCLPGGGMPPLPPGRYRAVLFQFRHLVPVPPPIAIRVTGR